MFLDNVTDVVINIVAEFILKPLEDIYHFGFTLLDK